MIVPLFVFLQITKLTSTSLTVLANMTAAFTVTCWVLTESQMQARFSSQPPTAAQVAASGTVLGNASDLGLGLDGSYFYGSVSPLPPVDPSEGIEICPERPLSFVPRTRG